jgi:ATP-binding cassette, subfamily B, bacterial
MRAPLDYMPPPLPCDWNRETVRRVASYLTDIWKTSPALVSVCVLTRLARAVSPAAMLWIWMLTLDGAVALMTGSSTSARYVWTLIGLELAVTVVTDLLGRWGAVAFGVLSDRFGRQLSVGLMNHAQTFELEAFEDPAFLDMLERARRESGQRLALLMSVLNIGQDLLSVVAFSMLFAALSGWFFLVIFAVAIPACIGETHFAAVSHVMFRRRSKERRFLDYLRYLCAGSQSVKEVKMFGLGPHLAGLYTETARQMEREDKTLATRRALVGGGLNIVALIGYYASYGFVFRMFLEQAITIGMLMFMIRALSRARGHVEQLTSRISDVAQEIRGVNDLYTCMERAPACAVGAPTVRIACAVRDGFELQDVGFRYPGAPRWALRHISLRLRVGETVALVGPNGAGKTTLVNLLVRFYEPTEGRILLDGIDLRNYEPGDLRKRIGAVFQDFMRYDLTVRENIGFGDLTALGEEARLAAAATVSGASALIGRLPRGYDQILGRRFEGGANLSGGEWQRLALARAFVGNPDVLILDEPTAALDAQAECDLFERMVAAAAGRLVILISHRFSTARVADRLVVLGNGMVQEEGTHEQLLARRGRYAALFEMQAAGYRRAARAMS